MTKQQISAAVRERLRKANEYIITRNGVDPYDCHYKHRKKVIVYAWEHNISYREALAILNRKNRKQ
jgi:hypothetical protein